MKQNRVWVDPHIYDHLISYQGARRMGYLQYIKYIKMGYNPKQIID